MLKNKENICILGGSDELTESIYLDIKKKYNKVIYIKFSGDQKKKKSAKKNIFYLHLYELKKCLDILNNHKVDKITLIGKLSRPDLSKFKLDGVIDLYLSKLMAAYKKGDGEILSVVISIFNEQGFKIVPIADLTSNFSFGKNSKNLIFEKNKTDDSDISKALKILNDLSKYDNAQSIVIDNGFILSIEAAEGTDEMLDKVYNYKKKLKINKKRSGILVKIPKSYQSLMADLPVIGTKTIKLLKKSKIKSIAVSKNYTLVNDLNKTIEEIKKNRINLYLI